MTAYKFAHILQRFITDRGLFRFEDGKLKLLGIYGRLNTILYSILLEKLLEENLGKKKADDLLYLLSESQSYSATKWAIERVGISRKGNEVRIFNEVASHSQLTGHGKHRLLRLDMNKKEIIVAVENNLFPLKYRELFGTQKEPVDHYTRGLTGGICKFLFGEEVVTICEQCPSMGKEKAIYRVIPLKGALKRYGRSARKFIPGPSLKTSVLKHVNIRKLTG
ncbi:MAG: hypothetical protein V1702_03000 [Candidatus Woesearchaeota archaeon]